MKRIIILIIAVLFSANTMAQNYFEGTIIRQNDVSGGNAYWARVNNLVRGSSDDFIAIKGNKFLLYRSADGLLNYIDADAGKMYIINTTLKLGYIEDDLEGALSEIKQSVEIFGTNYKETEKWKDIVGIKCQQFKQKETMYMECSPGDVWITTEIQLPEKLMYYYKLQYGGSMDGFIMETNRNWLNASDKLYVKEISRVAPSDEIMTIPSDIVFVEQNDFQESHQKYLKALNKQRKKEELIDVKLKVDDNIWDF